MEGPPMLDFDLQVERFIAVLGINKSINTAKAYRSDLRLLKLHLVLACCDCVIPPQDQTAYAQLELSCRLMKTACDRRSVIAGQLHSGPRSYHIR